jgi:hypothetical protein
MLEQSSVGDRHAAGGDAEQADEHRLSDQPSLLCANQPRSRRGALGIGPRGVGARPELVVDQRVNHAPEDVTAVDVGLRRCDGTLSGQRVEKRGADGALHVEARERLARPRPVSAASAPPMLARRRPKSTTSHESSAPDALPHTLSAEVDASTGPDIAGMTDCGSTWPKMLFAVARLDCQIASSLGR